MTKQPKAKQPTTKQPKSKQPTTKQPKTKQPKIPQPAHTAIFETVDHSLLSPVPGGFAAAAKTILKNVQA
ncbi:hypothetical protein L596_021513 [Steinernema carpocapsae]|uniref:Uncharacterized protein n=1 Tax=Steinernema carpocapsae TaxID=34508 RepID=A0A4U5MIZ0_STECR|nr:hypothetical protein L596_021513 [Steinernema carpocapsae]